MSLFTVPVLALESIEPHPNADRLELAVVGGFRAVVGKGSFTEGSRVVYLPTDSVVPADVADALGVGDYLAGKNKDRVKAIRLRGVLSEGIVVPVDAVRAVIAARGGDAAILDEDGVDLASALGIEKYIEPIPVAMQGRARPWPSFVPEYDIENVKRPEYRGVFEEGEPVVLTEKRHGTNMAVALGPGLEPQERAYVLSRGRALLEDHEHVNLYWLTVDQHDLIEKLQAVRAAYEAEGEVVETISLHGESLGCQDLRYGATMQAPAFEAFDLRVNGRWLDFSEFRRRCEAADIPMVPVLYEGPYSYAMLDEVAEGEAAGGHGHMREGVVIRPIEERTDPVVGRVQLKYVSGTYLTRTGKATEHR